MGLPSKQDREQYAYNPWRRYGEYIRNSSPIWISNLDNYTRCYLDTKDVRGHFSVPKANQLFRKRHYEKASAHYLYNLGKAMLKKAGFSEAVIEEDLGLYEEILEIEIDKMYRTGKTGGVLKALEQRQLALNLRKPPVEVKNDNSQNTYNAQIVNVEIGKHRVGDVMEKLPASAKEMFLNIVGEIQKKRIGAGEIKLPIEMENKKDEIR